MGQLGRVLIFFAALLAGMGLLLILGEKLGLCRLPGDILLRRKNNTVYFPVVTSLVVSAVLTLILNLLFRRK
ncbi:MAG: DUF2905 domain-containing protein [Polyangiales bacterium]